ncbi:conserved hypothetical protein [Ricinus communis]|uniref:Uncharacterized protein n=1 Tax=Ricinus communis TaxID=3988 RepID=B9SDV2_RICCO|nr:conserved hypothetical protein [Ricinus communis]
MTGEEDNDLLSSVGSSTEKACKEPMVEGTFVVSGIPIPYGCATLTLSEDEGYHSGITVQAISLDKLKRVILKKPSLEMTKHIRPLYVKPHLNGRPFSRVLVDNSSAVNILPYKILNALGKKDESFGSGLNMAGRSLQIKVEAMSSPKSEKVGNS